MTKVKLEKLDLKKASFKSNDFFKSAKSGSCRSSYQGTLTLILKGEDG